MVLSKFGKHVLWPIFIGSFYQYFSLFNHDNLEISSFNFNRYSQLMLRGRIASFLDSKNEGKSSLD